MTALPLKNVCSKCHLEHPINNLRMHCSSSQFEAYLWVKNACFLAKSKGAANLIFGHYCPLKKLILGVKNYCLYRCRPPLKKGRSLLRNSSTQFFMSPKESCPWHSSVRGDHESCREGEGRELFHSKFFNVLDSLIH